LLGIFIACNEDGITNKGGENAVLIVPSAKEATEAKTLLSYVNDYQFPVAVATIAPVMTNTDVTIAIDSDQVAAFNTTHNTNYSVMPEGSYSLEATSFTILKDSVASEQSKILVDATKLQENTDYLLPVKVASVSESSITINPAMATKYYIFRAPTPVLADLSTGKASRFKSGEAWRNPQRGNDGNTSGEWGDGSVCESGAGAEQYWEVDLGSVSPRIDNVKIWNRTDCCDERTIDFYVFISEVPFTGSSVGESLAQPGVKAFYTAGKAGRPTQILPNVAGRYIRLQNTGGQSLTLAELTAIGIKP
jgi:hypothetical protein